MSFATTFAGRRVLDLGTNFAAPFAAMVLGDLGAEVIKVERSPQGDDTRALPPWWNGVSTVFLSVNRNKRSVMLDLKSREGRGALMRLVARADVVIESFPPGYAAKAQLTFEDFRAKNSRIVVCSMSAFGDGTIGGALPGYDALVQAVSGMMSFTGHPDSAPVRIAPSVLDLTTGLWGVIGVQAALTRCAATGQGEHVTPSLIDTAMTMMGHQVLGRIATGIEPEKLGSGAPSAAPYRVYLADDGPFMLATASDAQFQRLCAVLELGSLIDDARFVTVALRVAHRAELDAALAAIFASASRAHWLARLNEAGIASGMVNTLGEALALPVVAERNLFVDPEAIGWTDGMPLLRLPIDRDAEGVRAPPPRLGADTEAILRELGYCGTELAALMGPVSC